MVKKKNRKNRALKENIKCPRCGNTDGYTILWQGRYFFRCPNCLYEGYLKTLNLKK